MFTLSYLISGRSFSHLLTRQQSEQIIQNKNPEEAARTFLAQIGIVPDEIVGVFAS